MPSNIVIINNSKYFKWYVGDSKMEKLMVWLDEHGYNETRVVAAKEVKRILIEAGEWKESEEEKE